MAASTTEAAMADSVRRAGMATTCSAASDSVSECAAVNAVTVRTMSDERGTDRRDRDPGAVVATQDRRQQQGEQEQHVIQPAPDVAHALPRRRTPNDERAAAAPRATRPASAGDPAP